MLVGKTSFIELRVLKPLLILIVTAACFFMFIGRFTVVFGFGGTPCLQGSLFLLDKHDQNIMRGDLFFMRSRNDVFSDDTQFIKIAGGVAGDIIHLDKNRLAVTSTLDPFYLKKYQIDLSQTAKTFQWPANKLTNVTEVHTGQIYALATLPGAYDSRSFGVVDVESQVIGKLYVIF